MADAPSTLSLEQVAALLRSTAQTIRAEAESLGGDGMRWHPAPGEWCVNEVVGHILEAERRGFAGRIQRIVAQPGRRLESWDPPAVAGQRRDCERDGLELVHELETAREESVRMLLGLTSEQFQLSGDHPQVGELRVIDLLHEWPHHDRNHLKQILSNVQACVWPNMGNARRFAEIE